MTEGQEMYWLIFHRNTEPVNISETSRDRSTLCRGGEWGGSLTRWTVTLWHDNIAQLDGRGTAIFSTGGRNQFLVPYWTTLKSWPVEILWEKSGREDGVAAGSIPCMGFPLRATHEWLGQELDWEEGVCFWSTLELGDHKVQFYPFAHFPCGYSGTGSRSREEIRYQEYWSANNGEMYQHKWCSKLNAGKGTSMLPLSRTWLGMPLHAAGGIEGYYPFSITLETW